MTKRANCANVNNRQSEHILQMINRVYIEQMTKIKNSANDKSKDRMTKRAAK